MNHDITTSRTEAEMAQIAVILIRVLLGLALGFVGVIALGQGLIMVSRVDFPTLQLTFAMFVGIVSGSALLFGAWRLLSTTLRLDAQPTQ